MSQVVENQQEGKKPFGNDGKLYARETRLRPEAELVETRHSPEATPVASCGTPRESSQQAIEDFQKYLQALKRSESTIAAYVRGAKSFIALMEEKGVQDMRAVRRVDLEAYQAGLMQSKNFTTNSAIQRMLSLRRFYDYLESTGKVLINPTVGLLLPKLETRLPRSVMTTTEIKKMLDAPDTSSKLGIRNKAILELLYSTGIRAGELCGLTIHDVDINGGFIRINQGKGAKDRIVPMGHTATKYVKEYLQHVRGHYTRNAKEERALFISILHTGLTVIGLGFIVRKIAGEAKISKHITPHTFRHTCATHMLAAGADIIHVQRMLGHAQTNTTQIYARVTQREIKKIHARCHPSEAEAAPEKFSSPRKFRLDYRRNKSKGWEK